MNALQKYELEEVEGLELNEETKQRYKIEDKEQLNWALRKISALNTEQNSIEDLADKEIDRIMKWREKEVEALSNSKDFFKGLIMEYAMNERTKDPKFKAVTSPYGKVTFKKQQPKWIYDEKKLVAFLKSNGYDFVRVKEEPEKAEIKKYFMVNNDGRVFDKDGQEVEGITVEFPDEKLDIKVGE